MMNKKGDPCMLYPYEKCDYCGYCKKYGFIDFDLDEPSEDELIEQALYESERESDLM